MERNILKKLWPSSQIKSRNFWFERMAEIFAVSRAGYYKFINKKPSKRDAPDEVLIKK